MAGWLACEAFVVADSTQSETAATVDSLEDTRFSRDLPARFAALLYELLGGPQRSDEARPPLSALGETANRVLQRALVGGALRVARSFGGSSCTNRRMHGPEVRILSWAHGGGTRGEVLRLVPRDGSVPIRFIARSQFCIGRSLAEADLLTRLHPKTPENEHRTHQLGRVHVCGEIIDGPPTLRDGNGTCASENGSMFDGQPLAHDRPTPIRRRAVLTLAGHYALEVIPHLAPTPDVFIENFEGRRGGCTGEAAAVRGAIVFARRDGEPMLRETVWLFSRVDFAPGKDDRLVWLSPARNNPAVFLHLGGCFWIVNFGLLPGHVRIDENPLARGEAARLGAGAVLEMGSRVFSIEVGWARRWAGDYKLPPARCSLREPRFTVSSPSARCLPGFHAPNPKSETGPARVAIWR